MTTNELNALEPIEYLRVMTYAWFSFVCKSQIMESSEGSNLTEGIEIDHPWVKEFEKNTFSPEFLNKIQSKITHEIKEK